MKATEVMEKLNISRNTLHRWRKSGKLKAKPLPSGHFDFDKESVYAQLHDGQERKTYLYTYGNESNSIESLKQFLDSKGYRIDGVFSDPGVGKRTDNRDGLLKLFDECLDGYVKEIIIADSDQFAFDDSDFVRHILQKCDVELITLLP